VSKTLTASERRTLATVLGINRASEAVPVGEPTQEDLDDLWKEMDEGTQIGLIVEWTVARAAATTSKLEIAIQLAKEIVLLLGGRLPKAR
jgi:hypothetical protein